MGVMGERIEGWRWGSFFGVVSVSPPFSRHRPLSSGINPVMTGESGSWRKQPVDAGINQVMPESTGDAGINRVVRAL
jgi:hypothetical protein